MRAFVSLSIILAGCGASRFRTEHVGTAQVAAGGGAASITLGRGDYQMAMRFDIPRAQIVEWTLHCPGVERSGTAGETFDAYRTRRLAELNRMVEQDRRRLAAVTNVITDQVGAQVEVRGPNTSVRAEAAAPSGEVVAAHAIEQFHELPASDVGAGSYTANLRIQTVEDGACTVTMQAIDPVGGLLAVDRIRDLHAEEQQRQIAQRATAIDARTRVRARLVSSGADEHARERRLAEQARLRDQERQRRAELEAQRAADREARRVAEREAQVKRDEENRLRLEAEARIRWEAEAPERARRARLEQERLARVAAEEEAEQARLLLIEERRSAHRARLEQERLARVAIEQEEQRKRLLVIEEERRVRIRVIEEERRTRLLIFERERTSALRVRGELVAWLVGTCNADPHRYARIQQERIERSRRIELEIIERERRIEIETIERTRRIEIERERVAREERVREQRQREVAFVARAQLSGYLVGLGARMRPPRPAPLVEVAGTAPFDGSRWEPGTWTWIQGDWQWQWRKGGWVDTTQFGEAGGDVAVRAPTIVREVEVAPVVTTSTTTTTTTSTAVDVSVPAAVTVEVPAPRGSITIDVTASPRPTVRDHRRPAKKDAPRPARVRDHRRR